MPTIPAPFDLTARTVIVTGAASGIGRATAALLARFGANIVVADRDVDGGRRTAAAIGDDGGVAVAVAVDVARREDVVAAVDLAVDRFGGLDAMCNIAGRHSPKIDLLDVGDEDLDREFAVSLRGVLHGCQEAARAMVTGGSIVNISSTVIDVPAAGYGLYHLGKTAAVSITRTLARELGPRGIRVNAIAPGTTLTEFSARNFTGPDGEVDEEAKAAWLETMAAFSPLGLVGAPEDQAALVLLLVSDAGRFVTGQVLRANGGWSMP